ncbi:MAG TPA: hypothetical protein VGF17_12830 [Phytomonospora sp.]
MTIRLALFAPLLAALTAVAGCGTDAAVRDPIAATAPSGGPPAASPTPSPTPSPQAPTTRVADCFDGDCVLLVSRPVSIPLDAEKFHYEVLEIVDVTDDALTYFVPYGGGGGASSQLGVGGGGGFGFRGETGISLRLTSIEDGTATLVISPDPEV